MWKMALPAIALLTAAAAASPGATGPGAVGFEAQRAHEARRERSALNATVKAVCRKQVVLLGEAGFHGDGRTVAFKADLVRRLVQDCGFKAVVFESGSYDFLEISRRRRACEAVSPQMISSAIGGVWNQDREIDALIPFLEARAGSGGMVLAGMDDQLGSRGAFYSLERMPVDLAGYLAAPRRAACERLLRQRIWSDYPRDAPYGEAARADLQGCLAEIRSAVTTGEPDRALRQERLWMLDNFERCIARDFVAGPQRVWDRDRSMFLNLRRLVQGLPAHAKIIVWSANAHVAKDARPNPTFGGPNLGGYVRQAYGDRAFALGFSAASGSYRYTVKTPRDIPVAAPGSLEMRALAGTDQDAVYVGPKRLAKLGVVSGAAFDDHKASAVRWADIYDGVIVFRAERPPWRRDE